MEQPVICVIVPVYKAEATLPRCIESVLTQQLPGGLRLILVDDQSPARSGEICDAYAAKDPRVMVLHRRERGVSGARNAGLAAACHIHKCQIDAETGYGAESETYRRRIVRHYYRRGFETYAREI